MDLTETLVPDSTQVNAEDFLSGPRTVLVTRVSRGTAEQPVNIMLAEYPGRAFRPSKTVRRILVAAWGPDGASYVGRRMTLYRDPEVTFGGQSVGGIRVSHLSHIESRLSVALSVTRGKRQKFVVDPLPMPIDAVEALRDIEAADTLDALQQIADAIKARGVDDRDRVLAAYKARQEVLATPVDVADDAVHDAAVDTVRTDLDGAVVES